MHFDKIHACGNDFILLDHTPNRKTIKEICHRQLGIGADGVMAYHQTAEGIRLEHFDPDGSFSYCLNGTRSTINCLYKKGLLPKRGMLKMGDRQIPYQIGESPILFLEKALFSEKQIETSLGPLTGYYVHVGNPHFILTQQDEETYRKVASEIRHNHVFPKGANVHWIQAVEQGYRILSYERGVESFTLSCGSGSLATACLLFQRDQMEAVSFYPDGGGTIFFEAKGPIIAMHGEVFWVAEGEWLCS